MGALCSNQEERLRKEREEAMLLEIKKKKDARRRLLIRRVQAEKTYKIIFICLDALSWSKVGTMKTYKDFEGKFGDDYEIVVENSLLANNWMYNGFDYDYKYDIAVLVNLDADYDPQFTSTDDMVRKSLYPYKDVGTEDFYRLYLDHTKRPITVMVSVEDAKMGPQGLPAEITNRILKQYTVPPQKEWEGANEKRPTQGLRAIIPEVIELYRQHCKDVVVDLFLKYDLNGDGKIDEDEFKEMLQ